MPENRPGPEEIMESWRYGLTLLPEYKRKNLWHELDMVISAILETIMTKNNISSIPKLENNYYKSLKNMRALGNCIMSILKYQQMIQTQDIMMQYKNYYIFGNRTFFSYIIKKFEVQEIKPGIKMFIRPSTKSKKTHALYLNPEIISELIKWPTVKTRAPIFGPAPGDRHGEND